MKYAYNQKSKIGTIERSAQFIALNETCFNGLYRVSKKSGFNVPIGKYKMPRNICNSDNLRNVSLALNKYNVTINHIDYKEIIFNNAKADDFIYFDPPYILKDATSNFRSYTIDGFSYKDQRELVELFKVLDKRGCKLLVTNSDTEQTRDLYKDYVTNAIPIITSNVINSEITDRKEQRELLSFYTDLQFWKL